MDVDEIARGLVVEHMEAFSGLRVKEMMEVKLPTGASRIKPEISEAMSKWLVTLIPELSFEISAPGQIHLAVKRVA